MTPFYRRWVVANALAEGLGLGGVMATGVVLSTHAGLGEVPPLLLAAAAIALGAFEGALVGFLQGTVLSAAEPRIARAEWMRMTILGAVVAWTLGMIPSTVIDLLGSAPENPTPMTEPPRWLQLLLAAGLGAVAGPLLALFQRGPLSRVTSRANRWLIANALAWAVGMPVTFLTMDVATAQPRLPATLTLIVLGMTLTGALVGGIHGRFLEKLLPQ